MAGSRNTPKNIKESNDKIYQYLVEEVFPLLPAFAVKFDKYFEEKELSVKTKRAYFREILRFFEYLVRIGRFPEAKEPKDITLENIEELTSKDVNDYLFEYLKSHTEINNKGAPEKASISARARARTRSAIVAFIRFLYTEDILSHDITSKIKAVPTKKEQNKPVIALEENEVMDLIDIVTDGEELSNHQKPYWEKTRYRDRLMIILFVVCGLRIHELQQLNLSSFNLKRETFALHRKRGKNTMMPMNRSVLQAYEDYLRFDRSKASDIVPEDEDALFLSLSGIRKNKEGEKVQTGRKRLSENQIRNIVHKYTSIAIGDNVGVSPHKLRATAATIALKHGYDVTMVKSLLDHSNIQTTMKYLKEDEEAKQKIVSSMEFGIKED